MIAQPNSTSTPAGIDQQVQLLHTKLDNALGRIQVLEKLLPKTESESPQLIPADSPAMDFAKQLCAEIFPGAVEIAVASAPEERSEEWYSITVVARGTPQDIVDNQLRWLDKFAQKFPSEAPSFRLSVKPA